MKTRRKLWFWLHMSPLLVLQACSPVLASTPDLYTGVARGEPQFLPPPIHQSPAEYNAEAAETTLTHIIWLVDSIEQRHGQQQNRLNLPLLDALRRNDTNQALVLIAQGADPNTRYTPPIRKLVLGDTVCPFFDIRHMAIMIDDHSPAFRTSLIPSPVPTSFTALMIACRNGWNEVYDDPLGDQDPRQDDTRLVEAMLRHGADVNATDEHGWTALMSAVYANRQATVHLLLEHGADVNAQTDDGNTVLSQVVKAELSNRAFYPPDDGVSNHEVLSGYPKRIKVALPMKYSAMLILLLAYGADPNRANKYGETPLSQAQQSRWPDVVALFKRFGIKK
jgi:ankyrin repeat protein